jgi:sterol desaturase/sphingolipid hydroxylase (fatty acid hydroxylase superfamily)
MTSIRSAPPVMQGAPSIYTLLGAVQSALWFFVLPPLCKPLWPEIFDGLSTHASELLLWFIVFPYFVLYVLAVALPPYLLQWDFFEQFRISKDVWPWKDERGAVRGEFWKLTRRSLVIDTMNMLIFAPIYVCLKGVLLPSRTMSFSVDDWPTYMESFSDIIISVVLHEFLFYWSHRLMHIYPVLYRHHKVHHEYKRNGIFAAQHFNPVDYLFSIAGPVILTSVVVRPHGMTQFQIGLWIITTNLDDHLGYAFPWSPVRWFPL